MTSSDQLVDLVVNKLTLAQYKTLSAEGKISKTEIYDITDLVDNLGGGGSGGGVSEQRVSAIAQAYAVSVDNKLTGYYTKDETNSLSVYFRDGLATTASLTAYETKSDLTSNYYKKTDVSSASELANKFSSYYQKTETSSASQLTTKFSDYYQKIETSSDSQLATQFAKHYLKTETSSASELDTRFGKYYYKTETSSNTEIATAVESLYTYIDQHDQMSILTASSSTVTPEYGTYTRIESSIVNSASSITINVSAPTDRTHTQEYSSATDGFELRIDGSGLSTSKSCAFSGVTVVSMDDEAGVIVVGKVAYVTCIWNGSEIEVFWRNATV